MIIYLVTVLLLAHGSVGQGDDVPATAGAMVDGPFSLNPSTFQGINDKSSKSVGYVVTLKHAPVVSYAASAEGGVATAAAGPDIHSAAAVMYADYVEAQSVAVAARTGVTQNVLYTYKYATSGFATGALTNNQLAALKKDPAVAFVSENRRVTAQTLTTPQFLKLAGNNVNGGNGVWERQLDGPKLAGDGVVVGVLDTGIMPEHEEFSDTNSSGALVYPPNAAGYGGPCRGGQVSPVTCNRKIVGCQFYWKAYADNSGKPLGNPLGCRDYEGHGTHTASTAAGNFGVPYPGGMTPGGDKLSGMAPHARIAAYKVLWGGSGYTADIISGIDDAVKDKVDVINYSIGGGPSTVFPDAIGYAFMRAAQAGIFVAASASNSGPALGTCVNNHPWATTVAASTHNRQMIAQVRLGLIGENGKYNGSAWWWNFKDLTGRVGPALLITGNDAAVAGVAPEDAQRCFNQSLDADKVQGKIVVCDRGTNGRVEKSAEVKRAGGIGMILLNVDRTGDDTTMEDTHSVPTVHLSVRYMKAVRKYASRPIGAVAALGPSVMDLNAVAPQMAGFSSRGPDIATGMVLKPDITAPGVNIYAAVSNETGYMHAIYSGTSMSSPAIAGLAALMRQKYPSWSPMMIKSALMTTAYQTTKTGQPGRPFGTPFDYGAGHVDPTAFFNPGLVFDSSFDDWAYYTCVAQTENIQVPDDMVPFCNKCAAEPDYYKCDPANLNMPSISLPALVPGFSKVVKRTVKSVLKDAAVFTATSVVDAGSQGSLEVVSVMPQTFTLGAGEERNVEITLRVSRKALFTQDNAGYNFGSITWASKGTTTRIPIAVKATAMIAPKEVSANQTDTKYSYKVMPGFSGQLDLVRHGLDEAVVLNSTISTNETTGFNVTLLPGHDVVLARWQLFSVDLAPAAPIGKSYDLDLVVVCNGNYAGVSASDRSDEVVSLSNPAPCVYTVQVNGYAVPTKQVRYYLHMWLLTSKHNNKMKAKVDPVTVSVGSPADVMLTFSKLDFSGKPMKRYLGSIDYQNAGTSRGSTIVSIVS